MIIIAVALPLSTEIMFMSLQCRFLSFWPTSFEMQTVQFAIIGIYRQPSTNFETFFDEVADLFDAAASAIGHMIFAGDCSCSRNMPETIDAFLPVLLSCYNIMPVNMPYASPVWWWNEHTRSHRWVLGITAFCTCGGDAYWFSDHSFLTIKNSVPSVHKFTYSELQIHGHDRFQKQPVLDSFLQVSFII